MEKERRTKIHECVQKAFGNKKVVGSTVTKDDKKYIVFTTFNKECNSFSVLFHLNFYPIYFVFKYVTNTKLTSTQIIAFSTNFTLVDFSERGRT